MILHQVFGSPSQDHTLQHCAERCQVDDGILLLQDAVYALQHPLLKQLTTKGLTVYVLQNDLEARGLSLENTAIHLVNDEQWLRLCVQYDKVMSWL